MKRPRLDVSAGGHLWVWYSALDRRNGYLAWGPVGTLFNRRRAVHWLLACVALYRHGDRRN